MIALQIAFLKVFELTTSAAVIAALVLIFRRVFRGWVSPSWMIWLWLILLVRLLLPVSVPGPVSMENWTDRYIYQQRYSAGWLMETAVGYWNEVRWQGRSTSHAPTETAPLPGYKNGNATQFDSFLFDEEAIVNRRIGETRTHLLLAMASIWLIGCLVRAGVQWRTGRRMKRLVHRALPCGDTAATNLLRQCKMEIGISSPVELLVGGTVFPFLYGLFKPRIMLPYDYKELYTETELRFILLHELQHWKMKDGCLQFIATAVQLMHWFNPFVHLAFNRLRDDVELRCDRRVTRKLSGMEKVAYGQLLLKQGELNQRLAPRGRIGAAIPWLERQSVLAERVRLVAHSIHETKATRYIRLAIAMLALVVGLGILSGRSEFSRLRAAASSQPTLYAFWLDESVNLRSMQTIRELSQLMAGMDSTASGIDLLLRQQMQQGRLEQWLASMTILVNEQRPVAVDTRPILEEALKRETRQGNILLMLHYPCYNGKLLGISVGKRSITDIATLEQLQQINLY